MTRSMSFTSARAVATVVVSLAGLGVLASACNRGRDANDPSNAQQQPNAYGQPAPGQYQQPGQYPPGQYQQPGQYPPGQYQQPGQPAPQQPGYTQPPAQPGAQPTAAPSPLALPCQNDMICGTHKCNLQTGRCAFPCTSNTDCATGFTCMGPGGPAAICVPGAGGSQ